MKAKKIFILLLALSLLAALLAGCGGKDNNNNINNNNNEYTGEPSGIVKLGLGVINDIDSSTDYVPAEGDNEAILPFGQVNTTMAAVAIDKDGRVVDVIIDTAQTRVIFDENLKVTNKSAEFKSKKELKEDYGMGRASSIGKEWYEQIEALEKWMIGKTIAEITGLKTNASDDGSRHVPDVPELTSSVTIGVDDYLAVVEKAFANTIEVASAEKLGLGNITSIAKSRDYVPAEGDAEEILPLAQVDTVISAAVFDKNGKVAGVLIDTAQIIVQFDARGKVTNRDAVLKTKKELKDDYGLGRISPIGKEWYEQIEALEKWMVGKTVAEITGMKTKATDDNHPHVPDVPELTSSVTITVEDYLAVMKKAAAIAR